MAGFGCPPRYSQRPMCLLSSVSAVFHTFAIVGIAVAEHDIGDLVDARVFRMLDTHLLRQQCLERDPRLRKIAGAAGLDVMAGSRMTVDDSAERGSL